MIRKLFRPDPHHRCFLPLAVFFLSLVMAMGLTITHAQTSPTDAPPSCPPEGCANPFDELLKKATLKKVLDNGSDASGFTGPTVIGGSLSIKELEVKENMKVKNHYFDANDDGWLRVKDRDGGDYKDVAVGQFWADKLAYLRGDIRLGDNQNSSKLYFGYNDNSKYIAVENWWMTFHGHGNEGWKFIDDTGDVIMQINGKGTNDGSVNIPNLLVTRALATDELRLQTGAEEGKVLTSDARGYAMWKAVPIPSGTSGQTLRHDGTKWVANSVLLNNGTNVGIGMANPSAKLDIYAPLQWVQTGGRASGYGGYASATDYYVNFTGDFYKQFSPGDKFKTENTVYTVRGIKDPGGYVLIDKAYVFPATRWNAPVFIPDKAPIFRVANEVSPKAVAVDGKGNVGIGTTTPASPLTIYNPSNVGPKLTLAASSGGAPGIDFRPYQDDTKWSNPAQASITATDNNWSADIHFSTKNPSSLGNALEDRMFIRNDGNVGIGTTDPKSKLQVNGTLGLHDANGDNGNKWSIYGWDNQLQFTKRNNDWSHNSTPLTIWEDGSISIPGIVGVGGIKFATGAGAGKVLTSDASGTATWQATTSSGENFWRLSGKNLYMNVIGRSYVGAGGGAKRVQPSGMNQCECETSFACSQSTAIPSTNETGQCYGTYIVASGRFQDVTAYEVFNISDNTIIPDIKVGIGTSSPTAKLHVVALGGFPNNVPIVAQSNGTFFGARDANGNERFAINLNHDGTSYPVSFYDKYDGNWNRSISLKNGNVGIGTEHPGAKLELNLNGKSWEATDLNTFRMVSPDVRYKLNVRTEIVSGGVVGWVFRTTHAGEATDRDALSISSLGNVGIGTANPQNKLHVAGGDIRVSLNDSSHNLALANDRIGLDVAELYETEESVEVGDVLVVGSKERKLRKSGETYQGDVIGIVSGSPALLFEGSELKLGAKPNRFTKGSKPPVALAGRVPVKVSLENGSIQPGDYLTTSSVPGVAMKATEPGMTIGVALEYYNSDKQTQVLAFVNVGERNVAKELSQLRNLYNDLKNQVESLKKEKK